MLVRAGVAGILGALIVVEAVDLGRATSTPGPTEFREIRLVSNPRPVPSSVAAVAKPTLTLTVAPSPVAAASTVAAPRVRVVGAGADEVNLRAEPSMRGARLKGLSDDMELELLGDDVEEDGRTWRNVRDSADRSEGWAAAEFLEPVE